MNKVVNVFPPIRAESERIPRKNTKLFAGNVIAMVPVRAGSTRVPQKNTRPFGNTSLLRLKLTLLKKLQGLKEIVVSTDCEVSADIAIQEGVKVQWRNKYYAGSEVTNDQHWFHIAETTPGDIVYLAQVTSPLVRVSSMQSALRSFFNDQKYDSINSVSLEKKFFWKDSKPLNYDITLTPRSQDLPKIVSLNFAITIIRRDKMMKKKNVVGNQPKFFELDKIESLDVDDLIDFKIAELIYRDKGIEWLMT